MADKVQFYTSNINVPSVHLEEDRKERTSKFSYTRESNYEKKFLMILEGFGEDAFQIKEDLEAMISEDKIDFDDEPTLIEILSFYRYYINKGLEIEEISEMLYEFLLQGKSIPWDFDFHQTDKLNYIATSDYTLITQEANYVSKRVCGNRGCKSKDVILTTVQSRGLDENWSEVRTCALCKAARSE